MAKGAQELDGRAERYAQQSGQGGREYQLRQGGEDASNRSTAGSEGSRTLMTTSLGSKAAWLSFFPHPRTAKVACRDPWAARRRVKIAVGRR